MLQLCLGSIRDYVREMATVRRQGHPLQSTIMSSQGDSLSDASTDDSHDDCSEDTESDGDSDITDGVRSKRNS
jgi:hypothetical protein